MAKLCLGIWHFKGENGCVQPSFRSSSGSVDFWKEQTRVYIVFLPEEYGLSCIYGPTSSLVVKDWCILVVVKKNQNLMLKWIIILYH